MIYHAVTQFLNAGVVAVIFSTSQLKLNEKRLILRTVFEHRSRRSPSLYVYIIEKLALVLCQAGTRAIPSLEAFHLLRGSISALFNCPREIKIVLRTIVNDIVAAVSQLLINGAVLLGQINHLARNSLTRTAMIMNAQTRLHGAISDRRPRCRTNARWHVRSIETHTFCRELIDIRSRYCRVAIATHPIVHSFREDPNNIGTVISSAKRHSYD